MKKCRTCLQDLPLEQFGADKTRKDNKAVYCKICFRERQKNNYHKNKDKWLASNKAWKNANREKYLKSHNKYYQKNKKVVRERISNWNARNKEKVLLYNHKRRVLLQASIFIVTAKDIKKVLQNPCFYCKISRSTTLDHIIPVTRGGNHSIGNLIGACKSCNSSKRTKTIMEFRLWKSNQIVT